jgi:hypothetical protein
MASPKRDPHRMVTMKIPGELYDNLGKLIEGTGFRSVTEFATYVLRDVAAGGKLDRKPPGLSDAEVEAVGRGCALWGTSRSGAKSGARRRPEILCACIAKKRNKRGEA